jgi:hypothetical protein
MALNLAAEFFLADMKRNFDKLDDKGKQRVETLKRPRKKLMAQARTDTPAAHREVPVPELPSRLRPSTYRGTGKPTLFVRRVPDGD